MNRIAAGVAIGAMVALAVPAVASTALQFSKVGLTTANIGQSFTIGFQDVSDPAGSQPTAQYSNISGAVNYHLTGVSHSGSGSNITSIWSFVASIANTSKTPMTSARISSFGFSTAAAGATGNNPTFLPLSALSTGVVRTSSSVPGTPDYEKLLITGSGPNRLTIPNVAGSNDPQICFRDGATNGCSGSGGLDMNIAANAGSLANPFPATSTAFTLAFSGSTQRTAVTLQNFFLRFQSLTGTGSRVNSGNYAGTGNATLIGDSGVGIVTHVGGFQVGGDIDPVPEPASRAMLIAGFGLVGTSLRRRRIRSTA